MVVAGILLAPLLWNSNNSNGDSPSKPTDSTPFNPAPGILPQIPVDVTLVVKDAELVYEMTDADVEEFNTLLKQCKDAALGGQSAEAVMELSDKIDDQYAYMNEQHSIATVLYYTDLKDEAASQLYLKCTDILTQAYNDYIEMAKALYDAEFPAKERFFEEWTEQDLAMLLSYTPEIMQLKQRNSEIEVAYQDMQDDSNMYTKMVPLYIEMVQNNNRIAQIYGYDNYYEYAYVMDYNRDYTTKDIETMRTLAARYLPKATEDAMNNLMDAMEGLSISQQTKLSGFLFNAYRSGYKDELEAYFASLPQQAREDMLDMFNGNIVMADAKTNAQEGAFTTSIGQDRYICFFGPGYSNPLTIIHEVGHYYGGMHTDLNDLSLDLAETQSQGNEWLFLSFLENEMPEDLYDALVNYKTYSDISMIMLCVIIDEFEERVYTHPNIASLTSDDLDAIMEDVCESYGGIAFLNNAIADVQSYWRMVVVEQPVYYISYGVSAIASMNIFTIADENYAKAVEIYCSLNEKVDLDKGFLGNISNAGLDGPFDEDFYEELAKMLAA